MESKVEDIEKNIILNSEKRIFKGWASIEIRDSQGEIIPIQKIVEAMPAYITRGGAITLAHTNKIVGKVLSYELKEKNNTLGLMITGQIFGDYEIDTQVWEKIKSGEYNGLSISGYIQYNDKKEVEKAELLEIAITPKPVNKEAKVVIMSQVAKSEEIKKEEEPQPKIEEKKQEPNKEEIILEALKTIIEKLDKLLLNFEEEKGRITVTEAENTEKCGVCGTKKSEQEQTKVEISKSARPMQQQTIQNVLTAKDIAKGKVTLDLIKFSKELRF